MSKRKEKPVTLQQMAAMEFEPWPKEGPEGLESFKDQKAFKELALHHVNTHRVAWAALFQSKSELVGEIAALDDDGMTNLVEGLQEATEFFEKLAAMTDAAKARVVVASASHWASQTGEAA